VSEKVAMPAFASGNVYDPFSYEMHENPYDAYKILRDRFPVYRNEERGFWALSRYDDVQRAARDWQTFSSEPGVDLDGTGQEYGPGNFIDLDPPRHDVLRKLVRHAFIPKQVRRTSRTCRRRSRESSVPSPTGPMSI
jgi:cytochrome P450